MEDLNNINKQDSKTSQKQNKQKVSLTQIIGGEILKEDFVIKQFKLLLLIAFLAILLISHRYSCLQKLTQIEDLKRQLNDVKYENLVMSTELTTNSRQSQIEDLLQSKGIDLSTSKTPAYEIYK